MNYNIIFEPEFSRVLPAVIIDCRATIPAIKYQVGSGIKSFTDSQVALIGADCLFYKIETDMGNIAGVFAIKVDASNRTAGVVLQYLRPAFNKNTLISDIVTNFIASNNWNKDFLF